MKERVFGPMGITDVEWLESPEGNTVGGWGLYLKTPDIAKIAILLANMGKWNGKQLIPEAYLKEATRKQIDTPEEKYPVCGYGYQYWITADNSFGVYGAFGNVIVVNPEKKLAVAVTAGASDKHGNPNRLISKIVNERLFAPTTRETLQEDAEAEEQLETYVDNLILPFPAGKENSSLEGTLFGKTIMFDENERDIFSVKIDRAGKNELLISFQLKDRQVTVKAGFEKWMTQNVIFDDPRHFLNSFAYAFADDKTLILKQYWLNMSGYDTYTLHYQGDVVNGMIITSVKLGGLCRSSLQEKYSREKKYDGYEFNRNCCGTDCADCHLLPEIQSGGWNVNLCQYSGIIQWFVRSGYDHGYLFYGIFRISKE